MASLTQMEMYASNVIPLHENLVLEHSNWSASKSRGKELCNKALCAYPMLASSMDWDLCVK